MELTSQSLERKVGQLFFIGIPGPELDPGTLEVLDEVRPGGICLFARNIKSREQTRRLNDDLREHLQWPLISVDEEGGVVDRLRRIMTPLPAAASTRSLEDAAELGRIIGSALSLLGFNMDFAPVVDVVDSGRAKYSNGLFTRPFGQSKEDVTRLAAAFLSALQREGILGCLKHFPGLGAAAVDSHEELPVVGISADELENIDMYPYRTMLSQAPAVMIAHAAYPKTGLQETDRRGKLLPSSLSKAFITTLLRERLGYDGLAITDDLEMGAIINNYGIGEACKMALAAGADMLAVCADPERILEGYGSVLSAVESGEIDHHRLDVSVRRIASAKSKIHAPVPFDDAKLETLSAETVELVQRLG